MCMFIYREYDALFLCFVYVLFNCLAMFLTVANPPDLHFNCMKSAL